MKSTFVILAALALLNENAVASAGLKQRAKELGNQINVRDGAPPPVPAQPPAPQTPATARPQQPAIATTQQQNLAKLQTDLAAIKSKSEVTPALKQQLAKDLITAAQGANKPSQASVTKFTNDLTTALADKNLPAAERARLATDINAVLNSANIPQTQLNAIVSDVQAVIQVGGVKRLDAITVANDLKAIAVEVRNNARK